MYYALIKRKSAKKWQTALPIKKGISKANARKRFRSSLKKGYSFKIVSESELKKVMLRMAKKTRKRKKK